MRTEDQSSEGFARPCGGDCLTFYQDHEASQLAKVSGFMESGPAFTVGGRRAACVFLDKGQQSFFILAADHYLHVSEGTAGKVKISRGWVSVLPCV